MSGYTEQLLERFCGGGALSVSELERLISRRGEIDRRGLMERARTARRNCYGDVVYLRGLIEFSSFCRNDCYYCGLRRSNSDAERYRLSREEILKACRTGYALGFRTFVLQGGEDPFYSAQDIAGIVSSVKEEFPDCALTLSIGERSREDYVLWYEAGADRYLLRHETASASHYAMLHPPELSLKNRKRCLYDLMEIGYQAGAGFMVGSPWQGERELAEDLAFLRELSPHMVGIGPFIPHKYTPFAGKAAGSLELTLFMLSMIRIMLPEVLLPATTALATLSPEGRIRALEAGANVVMPNLSPADVRGRYLLYDNKACTGTEAAEFVGDLERQINSAGLAVAWGRGDHRRRMETKNV